MFHRLIARLFRRNQPVTFNKNAIRLIRLNLRETMRNEPTHSLD